MALLCADVDWHDASSVCGWSEGLESMRSGGLESVRSGYLENVRSGALESLESLAEDLPTTQLVVLKGPHIPSPPLRFQGRAVITFHDMP